MGLKMGSARVWMGGATVVAGLLLLAGCSDKKETKAASQVAARVNGSDITVHQINFRLQGERGLKPEQLDAASRRVLDQLIDQELTVQKAVEQKLDRDPRVVQQLEAARREVLARAYLQQVASTVQAPTPDAVRKYFDDNPGLFSQRRVYQLREYVTANIGPHAAEMATVVAAAKSPAEFEAWAKTKQLTFQSNVAVRPAERIPLGLLAQLAPVANGHGVVMTADAPLGRVMFVVDSRPQPATFEQVKGAIQEFLTNEARRKAVEGNVAALKTNAKIAFEGKFAGQAASAPALSTTRNATLESGLPASGVEINLPSAGAASSEQISLPGTGAAASGVSISLPTSGNPGVSVSLPNAGASGVEVRLPGVAASAAKP